VAIIFEIQITQTLRQPLLDLVCFRPECLSWLRKRLFSTNLFALKIYCYAATSGTSGETQAGKKGASNACPTIYGIAAIVANCKCCGKQVN